MFDRLRDDIRCTFERDPAARTAFEVLTTYPGLHAVMVHRFSHVLWNRQPEVAGPLYLHRGAVFYRH